MKSKKIKFHLEKREMDLGLEPGDEYVSSDVFVTGYVTCVTVTWLRNQQVT